MINELAMPQIKFLQPVHFIICQIEIYIPLIFPAKRLYFSTLLKNLSMEHEEIIRGIPMLVLAENYFVGRRKKSENLCSRFSISISYIQEVDIMRYPGLGKR